jgi:hypothetical protein
MLQSMAYLSSIGGKDFGKGNERRLGNRRPNVLPDSIDHFRGAWRLRVMYRQVQTLQVRECGSSGERSASRAL